MGEEHTNGVKTDSKQEPDENKDTGADTDSNPIHEDKARGESIPSTILEKGIIYVSYNISLSPNSSSLITNTVSPSPVLHPCLCNHKLRHTSCP